MTAELDEISSEPTPALRRRTSRVVLPLTGRGPQLDWLEGRLRDGGSVLIIGDAGIGKTRLMTEVLDRASADGRPVGWVAATSSSLALPLVPLAHLLPTGFVPGMDAATVQQALLALGEAGGDRPLLLGVDDVPLLDDLSILVLHQAVTAGFVQILGTVRRGVTIPDGVDQIWRSSGGARLELNPLGAEAVSELVARSLGGPVDGATDVLINEISAGSPLLVLELLAHGRDSGRLAMRTGLWHWSGDIGTNLRLRELVGLNLDQLEPDARTLVELVALAEPIPVRVLEHLAPADVIDEVDRCGFIATGAAPDTVRPSHPIVAEQIVATIGDVRRRRLLQSLVDAFEATTNRGDLTDHDRIRVALWSLECGRDLDVDDLRVAARLAASHRAPAEAERLARAAFRREPDVTTGLLLGRMLHGLGDYDEAEAVYASIDARDAPTERQVELIMNRVLTLRFGLGDLNGAEKLIAAAREREDNAEYHWALTLAEARLDAAQGEMRQVLAYWDAAERDLAPELVRYQLAEWVCGAYSLMGLNSKGLEMLSWVGGGATRWGSDAPLVAPIAQFWWALGLAATGEVATATGLAEPFYEAAVRDRNNVGRAYGAIVCTYVALHRADLHAAERFIRESTLVPPTSLSIRLAALCGLSRVLALQGRWAEAAMVLDDLVTEEDSVLSLHDDLREAARALLMHHDGHERAAVELLEHHAASAEAKGLDLAAVQTLFDLVRLGHPRRARAALERLTRTVEGPFAALTAAYAAAFASGDATATAAVADQALDAELRLVAVAALTSAMDLERADGRPAAAAIHEARRTELLRLCPGLVVSAAAVDLGLTPRELEVARLAAGMMPDKKIAAELGLSVRTVNSHMRSIFTKLGITERSELADLPGLGSPS